jgi:hypothetical protein
LWNNASRDIGPRVRQRRKLLDELGEEKVFWRYVSNECRTVRELAAQLFEPYGDADRPGCKEFYEWLHAEDGRWQRWQVTKRFKATFMAEDALEPALAAEESNVRSARLKADYLKWMSGVLDPELYGGRTRVEVAPSSLTMGEWWHMGMRHIAKTGRPSRVFPA